MQNILGLCKVGTTLNLPHPSRAWWFKPNPCFCGCSRRFSQLLQLSLIMPLCCSGFAWSCGAESMQEGCSWLCDPAQHRQAVLMIYQHSIISGDLVTQDQIIDSRGGLDDTSHLLMVYLCITGHFALFTKRNWLCPWPKHPRSWSCASLGPKDDWISMRLYSSTWKVLSNSKILFY